MTVSFTTTLAVIVFLAGLLPGLFPLARTSEGGRFLSFGNAFAGGLFFGIALLHMLAEANEEFGELVPDYPVAFLIFAGGFLSMLFLEHVVSSHSHHARSELTDELGAHAAVSFRYAYALMVALTLHSLLAGLALGSQEALADAVAVLIAIVVHKTTEAFALGVSFARNQLPRGRAVGLLALFATAAPAGLLVGRAALQSSTEWVTPTLVSFAGGTFMYIATLDILDEEFTHGADRGAKWMLATAGVAMSAALAAWG